MYKKTRIAQGNLNIKSFRVIKVEQKCPIFEKLAVQLVEKSLMYKLHLPTKVWKIKLLQNVYFRGLTLCLVSILGTYNII